MIRLPLLAGGLVIYLGLRSLWRGRGKNVVRLRDGRRVRLQSSVALLNGSANDLLALEYATALPDAAPEELRLEALSLVQTVGSRAEYQRCRSAVVTARSRGERRLSSPKEHTFTFRRNEPGPDWYPTDGLD